MHQTLEDLLSEVHLLESIISDLEHLLIIEGYEYNYELDRWIKVYAKD